MNTILASGTALWSQPCPQPDDQRARRPAVARRPGDRRLSTEQRPTPAHSPDLPRHPLNHTMKLPPQATTAPTGGHRSAEAALACPLSRSKAGSRWVHIPYHYAVSGTFNSLFKVLFTFRSLYLYSIGLPRIFSLRRAIPPV